MLGFWHKLINGFPNKISCILNKLIYNLHIDNVYLSEWLKKIKDILYKCGMSEYWLNPNKVKDTNYTTCSFKKLHKEKRAKLYTDNWMNELQMSSKCSLYSNFKVELKMEISYVFYPIH